MREAFFEHSGWLMLAGTALVITLVLTLLMFWRNRYIDRGPRKGVAAHPAQVKRDNPPDH